MGEPAKVIEGQQHMAAHQHAPAGDEVVYPRASVFRAFACKASQHMGTPWAFAAAVLVVLGWLITGPLFGWSEQWQLVINTGTTIVTFLMVFLVQSTQNRDARAIQLKLDELIRTSHARNVFADLEDASDDELDAFQREFHQLRRRGLAHELAVVEARKRTRRKRGGPSVP